MPTEERFWGKVDKSPDCWLWAAGLDQHGYGRFFLTKKEHYLLAHRVAYTMLVGPIPDGLQLDHLCRITRCVNPDHLEPVTARTNVLRSESWSAVNARKTHCPQGHEYTEANIYRRPKTGGRGCRACGIARYQ
jgi:hypothetical protein